jgi:hypothetical protein
MAEENQRPRFYVSCTEETFYLVHKIARYMGTKPSLVAAMSLSVGAKRLAGALLPDEPDGEYPPEIEREDEERAIRAAMDASRKPIGKPTSKASSKPPSKSSGSRK